MIISPYNIRVWDVEKQKMIFMPQLLNSRSFKDYFIFDESQLINPRMRSVGFADRNGQEIYEKDYVKIYSKKFGNKLEIIAWIPQLAKFGWGGCTPGGTPHSFSIGNAAKIFEVVGNEFEGVK